MMPPYMSVKVRYDHYIGQYVPHSLRRVSVLKRSTDFFSTCARACETGLTVHRPYPRRLESQTVCRCCYKGSTFSSRQYRQQGNRLLLGSQCFPCLEIAVILAAFQTSGNVEDKREALTIDVIKGSMIGRLSLRTRLGTLSIPGALILGIAFMMSATCSQST